MKVTPDMNARTLYQKIWDDHVVEEFPDGTCLLMVDRQLAYESSIIPLERIAAAGRQVRRPSASLAMADHSVPTVPGAARAGRARKLAELCERAGITYLHPDDPRHGIVHVVGPEQGFTQPGLLMACADSHTSSHGALGALAFGIGTSEMEHVLSTQTLMQKPSRTMRIVLDGELPAGVVGKDLALAMIHAIGAAGGVGHAVEFAGTAVERLPMSGRLTLCNMAVEGGARSGMIAPDEITFEWLEGRPWSPKGALWDAAVAYWRTLRSDPDARFDREVRLDVGALVPQVTWGTSPDEVVGIDGRVPDPAEAPNERVAAAWQRSLDYMGLTPGTALRDVTIDRVFIGSCTNSRLDDLREAARILRGRRVAPGVHAMAVPGSGLVRAQAEAEGLDRVFLEAGFEWRLPGCSMCFGSPNDSVAAGERCASTSNRNFESRQGKDARTHLVSPAMAAAAAVAGHFVDIRELGEA